jgi:hypothetical protein
MQNFLVKKTKKTPVYCSHFFFLFLYTPTRAPQKTTTSRCPASISKRLTKSLIRTSVALLAIMMIILMMMMRLIMMMMMMKTLGQASLTMMVASHLEAPTLSRVMPRHFRRTTVQRILTKAMTTLHTSMSEWMWHLEKSFMCLLFVCVCVVLIWIRCSKAG